MSVHPELQYLDLLRRLLGEGDRRVDRTGVGTLSLFGETMRFDLADGGMPILTTKRVYWRTAVKEMLWFLAGETSIRPLLRNGVRIWTEWPLEAYRRATGDDVGKAEFERRIVEDDVFAERWADLGPVYGRQWRRWQGPDGREIDQIASVIETLRTNPGSRRILFHAWNVADIERMALPPCHMVYQFHVDLGRGRLNLALFQRSADSLLGLPWNIVGASALVAMIAQQCDLVPGGLTWFGGDVHLYLNHLDQAREQISREPRPFPRLSLARRPDDIDGYRIEDFIVEGYDPHPPIDAEIAV